MFLVLPVASNLGGYMFKKFLLGKIHRAKVTHSELHYEGSCAIDSLLLKAAGMECYEAIDIYNVTNGERFSTYIIEAPENSGIISVNGAAAHKANKGDLLIIATYGFLSEKEKEGFLPKIVFVDSDNKVKELYNKIDSHQKTII